MKENDRPNLHKVEVFKWIEGVLEKAEHFFEHFIEALEFSDKTSCHKVKVYNINGDLHRTIHKDDSDKCEEYI